jgi:hypothetical protein
MYPDTVERKMRNDTGTSNLHGLAARPVVGRQHIVKIQKSWGASTGHTRNVHIDNFIRWSAVPGPGADGKIAAHVAAEENELLARRVNCERRTEAQQTAGPRGRSFVFVVENDVGGASRFARRQSVVANSTTLIATETDEPIGHRVTDRNVLT